MIDPSGTVKKPPDIDAAPAGLARSETQLVRPEQRNSSLAISTEAGPSKDRDNVVSLYGRRRLESPPPPFALPKRFNPASAAHLAPPAQSLAYSPWDVRLSPIVDFSAKGKNKDDGGSNPHDPADSLSPAATASPPAPPSSVEFSSDDEMDVTAAELNPEQVSVLPHPAPIRIRRVGALGISVDSGSTKDGSEADSEDLPASFGIKSKKRGQKKRKMKPSSLARTRDQADTSMLDSESKANTFDEMAASEEVETAGGTKHRKKTKAISDANYRAIVDDLTVENQALKNRLRRFEGTHLPADMKKDRLFEVRYFDGLPRDRRDELAQYLTHFVRKMHDKQDPPPPESESMLPATRDPPRLLSLAPPANAESLISDMPAPVIPERKLVKHRRKRDEREILAGPSNSGVEPPSLTGTGSGLQVDNSGEDERPAKKSKSDQSLSGPPRDVIREDDEARANELVHVLERLFQDSMSRMPDTQPVKRKSPGTNEAYLGALLQNDDLSGGWTYLNLVSTMAQLHRFNVTASYVQAAIRYFSKNLELSADGAKVRWIGPKPTLAAKRQKMPPAEQVVSEKKQHGGSNRSQSSESTSDGTMTSSEAIFSEEKTTSGQASTAATTEPPQSVAPPPDKILRGEQPTTVIQRIPQPPSNLRHEAAKGDDGDGGAQSDEQAHGSTDEVETSSNEIQQPGENSNQKSHVQYVSFFNRWRKGHSTLRSSSSSSGNDSSGTSTLEGGQSSGKLTFYSSVNFCSDFTQDTPLVLSSMDLDLPFPPLGAPSALHQIYGEANKSLVPELLDYDIDMDHVVPHSLDEIPSLAVFPESRKDFALSRSSSGSSTAENPADDMASDCMSGFTDVKFADFFTMIVTTSHPTSPSKVLRRRKTDLMRAAQEGQLSLPLPLPPRPVDVRFVTLSTEMLLHKVLDPPKRKPLLPHLMATSSSSSDDGSSREDSAYSPPLLSSRAVPRAPSPDYLISLAMPFFAWAPRHQRPFSAAGAFWKNVQGHDNPDQNGRNAFMQVADGPNRSIEKVAADRFRNGDVGEQMERDGATGGARSVLSHSRVARNDSGGANGHHKRKHGARTSGGDDVVATGAESGDSSGQTGQTTAEDTTSDEFVRVDKRRKISPPLGQDKTEASPGKRVDNPVGNAENADASNSTDSSDARPIDLDESVVVEG
ncbi:hypothetical protein OIV83_001255 [Microbotryomycetes sp. JL201]|nr:hypothetical protein OIV83_001255 [Microbotryomycetes sp. JL201]